MKTTAIVLLVAVAYLSEIERVHSAPFENLGFDNANTNTLVGGFYGPASDLLPGWQVFHGSQQLTSIYFNSLPLNSDVMGLMSESTPNHYYLYFDTGQTPFSLVQDGDIPAGATKMVFDYQGEFHLTIDGRNIQMISPGVMDISAFSGQNVELRFTTDNVPAVGHIFAVDDIMFVPEPSVVVLLTFGVIGVYLFRSRIAEPLGAGDAGERLRRISGCLTRRV